MKAQTKKKTAAEHYADLKDKAKEQFLVDNAEPGENETLYMVTSPTGMEWQVRRPNIDMFVKSGVLPAGLSEKLFLAKTGGNSTDLMASLKTLSPYETLQLMEFRAALLRYICINPRIVEVPQADNEIAYGAVTEGDVEALSDWAIKGGERALGLGKFPGGRQQDPLAVAARPRHKKQTQPDAGSNGQGDGVEPRPGSDGPAPTA